MAAHQAATSEIELPHPATSTARLAALQADVARYQSALSDPNLYARDPARFRVATAALSAAEAALAEAEEQWLTLELLREELEA